MRSFLITLVVSSLVPSVAWAATVEVGPGKTYAKPCEAFANATDGDTITIDAAGDYAGDVCTFKKNNLRIQGVGGHAKIDAAGKQADGKAIWVIQGNDTTIENVEFTGAKVPAKNGAGIRQEGNNLTLRGCFFHDNENGILAGDKEESNIDIETTEFARNGYGDGQTHNLYINHVRSLRFRFNYSHDGKVGHLLKSRAKTNVIEYNRLTDEGGNASYEIDLPNGGTSYIVGNIIEQGAAPSNAGMVAYGMEGPYKDWGKDLYIVNNTFINRRANGGTFLLVDERMTTPAKLTNNIFFGKGTITTQGSAQQTTNCTDADPKFVDAASYDFRLTEGSPCIDKGTLPPSAGATSLVPELHYVHPMGRTGRRTTGTAIDIGAYELNGDAPVPTEPGTSSSSGSSGASGSSGGTAPPGGQSSGAGADGGSGQAAPTEDDGGCGCRTTSSPSSAFGAALLVGAVALVRGRLRATRRSPRR